VTSNNENRPVITWTIAGSDSGGGAGIQADLHTFQDFGVHGCCVITAATAQNSFCVAAVNALDPAAVKSQIDALHADLPASVIKLGMLGNAAVVRVVVDYLRTFDGTVVCDPVLVSTSGGSLLDDDGRELFMQELLPLVDVLTPNLLEAEKLLDRVLDTPQKVEQAARDLRAQGADAVLIKGGHARWWPGLCVDYFDNGTWQFWLQAEAVENANTHGSGCTMSAAITAALASGFDLDDAITLAKMYVTQGIRCARALGRGQGPVAHAGMPRQLCYLPSVFHHASAVARRYEFPRCDSMRLGLYPVVDSVEWLQRLLALGVRTIQLRIKDATAEYIDAAVQQAVQLARQYDARLFINDYWQLAIRHGAYGVHLGQEDLDGASLEAISAAGLHLGISTHNWLEIARAHAIRPSYIAIGPVFPTTLKKMRWQQQGVQRLQQWVQLLGVEYPLVAIGGINESNADDVLATGVGSVAVVSAITQAADYRQATQVLMQKIDAAAR
jgi:hydroxymethylpyrimidine kinase/phosphomethylpyrimidine kinase/thiamine-phosphate diphosphorylase